MSKSRGAIQLHPLGEPQNAIAKQSRGSQAVDTYGGKVHLRWDADAPSNAQILVTETGGYRLNR